jgi:hypothetical protein
LKVLFYAVFPDIRTSTTLIEGSRPSPSSSEKISIEDEYGVTGAKILTKN